MSDFASILNRWNGPPAYTEGGAPLRRTCTSEYKIKPQEVAVRAWLEDVRFDSVVGWRGHSMDEVRRAKHDDRQQWFTRWPLLEARLFDADLAQWAQRHYGTTFRWSACYCCPFVLRNPQRAYDLYQHDRAGFEEAATMDAYLRNMIPRVTSPSCWLIGPAQPMADIAAAWDGDREARERVAGWPKAAQWLDPYADSDDLPLFTGADVELPSGMIACDSGFCGL